MRKPFTLYANFDCEPTMRLFERGAYRGNAVLWRKVIPENVMMKFRKLCALRSRTPHFCSDLGESFCGLYVRTRGAVFSGGSKTTRVYIPSVVPKGSSDTDKKAAMIDIVRPDDLLLSSAIPAKSPNIPHRIDKTTSAP
jgi:hypothetical protein